MADRLAPEVFTTEALCARILERNRDHISVRKDGLATVNLARIIEAVLKLSVRQGFHETTLRDLARETGLSMGGLYPYFDNKITLLTMILSEVAITVEQVLSTPPPGLDLDAGAHLSWLIERHLRLTEVMQPWFSFAYMEAKGFPHPARRLAVDSELATERMFAAVLTKGRQDGLFRIDDVDLTASLIKPLLQDWYVKRSKYKKRGVTLERYIVGVLDFVNNAIGRHAPGHPH